MVKFLSFSTSHCVVGGTYSAWEGARRGEAGRGEGGGDAGGGRCYSRNMSISKLGVKEQDVLK